MKVGKKPKYPTELPEWFSIMADDGCLDTADICRLFGFKTPGCMSTMVKNGFFPSPDMPDTTSSKGRGKRQWSKTAIVSEIERRRGNSE